MPRRILLTTLLGCLLVPSSLTHGQALTDGLIGHWPFDGNGSDASGGGRPLNLYGGAGFAPGLFGQALDLHGNGSQYAGRISDDGVFDFGTSDFTVQIWASFNTVTPVQNLIEKFQGTDGPGWTLVLAGPDPKKEPHFFAIDGQINLYGGQLPSVQAGMWQQFVGRRKGAIFDLIHNGEIVRTGTNALPVTDTSFPLIFGRRNNADGRVFALDGRLDEAAIWSRALSNDEIALLYNDGAGRRVPEPTAAVVAATAFVALALRRRRASVRALVDL